ncbi:MAG TPA: hypothetical protein VGO63_02010 [Candidatus Paceibacterota bacterium]|jgi:hypothetical protein|nr:hypothetical protein [Candidatus Paceibacterota bacterium]
MKTKFLFLDEKEHAIDSLTQSLSFLVHTEQNPFNWKWFIIAFHNTLHSFMLLALKKGDLSGIWENEDRMKVNDRFDVFSEKGKLVDFMKAFKWIQEKERMSKYAHSKEFKSENIIEIENRMKALNTDLRNQFIHFRPVAWGASPDYITEICYPLIELLEFLGSTKVVPMSLKEENLIKEYTASIKSLLKIHLNDSVE